MSTPSSGAGSATASSPSRTPTGSTPSSTVLFPSNSRTQLKMMLQREQFLEDNVEDWSPKLKLKKHADKVNWEYGSIMRSGDPIQNSKDRIEQWLKTGKHPLISELD